MAELEIEAQMVGFGSVFKYYLQKEEIVNYRDTLSSKNELFMKFQKEMMKRGVFILPKPNKRCHISAAHTIDDVNYTLGNAEKVLKELK